MSLVDLCYRINHEQKITQSSPDEHCHEFRQIYELIRLLQDTAASPAGQGYLTESHQSFLQALLKKLKAYNFDLANTKDPNPISDSTKKNFLNFVIQSCLVINVPDRPFKCQFVLGRLKLIKDGIIFALKEDAKADYYSKSDRTGIKETFSLDFPNQFNRGIEDLKTSFKAIKDTIEFTYGRDQFTNFDALSLISFVKQHCDSIKGKVESYYYERDLRLGINKFFFDDIPKFLQLVNTDVHLRFNPLSNDENQRHIDNAVEKVFKLEGRRLTDDAEVSGSSLSLGLEMNAYRSIGQGDKREQQDRAAVSVFTSKTDLSALQIADFMFEAIQCHIDDNRVKHNVGSTLNWSTIYDGNVITANVGDSKAFLVTKTFRSGIKVRALNWEHKPKDKAELPRFKKIGTKVHDNNRIMYNDRRGLNMSRAIGDRDHHDYGLISTPDFTIVQVPYEAQSWVINVSDGVTGSMSLSDIEEFLQSTEGIFEGNLADQLRREAYQRYPGYVDADNIAVVVTPVIADCKKLILATVHDGHRGDSVSNDLHKKHQKYFMNAATHFHCRLAPEVLTNELRDNVEHNLVAQIDALVTSAKDVKQTALQEALELFKASVEDDVKSHKHTQTHWDYEHSDVVGLINVVVDAVRSQVDRMPEQEQARRILEIEQLARVNRLTKFGRSLAMIASALLGMYVGIMLWSAALLSMTTIASATFAATFMAGLITLSGGAIGSLIASQSIFKAPKEVRRYAAEQVLNALLPEPAPARKPLGSLEHVPHIKAGVLYS